jgi:hypothetical protein
MRAAARRSASRRQAAEQVAPQCRVMRERAGALATAASALRAQAGQGWLYKSAVLPPGGHAAAVAGMAAMVRQLEAAAVAADRAAGATWAQIGAPLGLSADAARRRYPPR